MPPIPAKTVVLTFDDAVKSHRTFVGPYLKELGFPATFFVSHRWMPDRPNFMTWEEIAELHQMGFEIGNHSWTHADFSQPRAAARLEAELALVDYELARVKVPKPSSFAWSGNGFGPEAIAVLRRAGIRLARRGGMPEVEYGRPGVGPVFDPARRHPLLIPTTYDSYPNGTMEAFRAALSRATPGQAVILQFHGVPDTAHPWVHTPPELFRQYMEELRSGGYRVLALRDLEPYAGTPEDPVLAMRHPLRPPGKLVLPVEMLATRDRLAYWRGVMAAHGYSREEAARVTGLDESAAAEPARARLLPYPGGRHPRLGFFEGMVAPMRGTKASVFLPWDPQSYVVVDVPEAVIDAGGVHFLGHTHIPTVWDNDNRVIDNVDWQPDGEGLRSRWLLPDGVEIGASIQPAPDGARMELTLRNGSNRPLDKVRVQVCVMLGRARGFEAQTNDNKTLEQPRAVVRSADGRHTIATEWEQCGRVWANPRCPCLHSDPHMAGCAPGETVRVGGWLRFS